MVGVETLIKSIVPNPVYSESFTELAMPDITATFQQLKRDYRDRGAKAIIIHSIICSVIPTAVGTDVCIIKDNYNKILMQFYLDRSFSGLFSFGHVIKASEINLIITGNTINIALFTIQYQYVYDSESKVLKR